MYQAFGTLAIFICLSAIIYVFFNSKIDLGRSISFHAAQNTRIHITFASIMTSGLLLLGYYGFVWLIPQFSLGWLFTIIFYMALVLETVTSWVPLTKGWRFTTHQITSYGTALLIPILLGFIAVADEVTVIARVMALVATLAIMIFIGLFLLVKSQRRYYLVYQTIYILCFFSGLLVTTYLG